MELALDEAARRLGISTRQAQRLAHEGKLQVVRHVGRSMLVDSSGVGQRKRLEVHRGRRWNPSAAWGAVELLEHGSTSRVLGATLSRLKSRLAEINVEELVRLSDGRAQVQRFMQTRRRPAALEDALVLTGRSSLNHPETAQQFGLAGGRSDIIEGYLGRSELDGLVSRFGLEPYADGAVFLHIGDEPAVESITTVALDLVGHGTARERSAAKDVLQTKLSR